ncbi:MAG: hypothetical protein JXA20_07225 [Spirochaetes bacterium]|nr:hypothetical protein [Spirochaetota bacterium]
MKYPELSALEAEISTCFRCSWKPGSGVSHFGGMGYFAWIVLCVRAAVEGTITDGDRTLRVAGSGYHDHNWLNFPFPRIIRYWMWGRIYSDHFTASYAFIQCNEAMKNHQVKVLMVARGREVVMSTGEFDFTTEDFAYNPAAKHRYPRRVTIRVPGELEVSLRVRRIMEAEDMLDNFSGALRFVAKHILRLKPGYFRLLSDFTLGITIGGKTDVEAGTTLHEIVLFKPAAQNVSGSPPDAVPAVR